jgi:hypothetical protein
VVWAQLCRGSRDFTPTVYQDSSKPLTCPKSSVSLWVSDPSTNWQLAKKQNRQADFRRTDTWLVTLLREWWQSTSRCSYTDGEGRASVLTLTVLAATLVRGVSLHSKLALHNWIAWDLSLAGLFTKVECITLISGAMVLSRVLESLSVRLQISDIFPNKSRVYYIACISGGIVYWLIQSTQLAFIHFREK